MKRITRHTHKPIERPSVVFPTPLPDYSAAADKLTDGHSPFPTARTSTQMGLRRASKFTAFLLHLYCLEAVNHGFWSKS